MLVGGFSFWGLQDFGGEEAQKARPDLAQARFLLDDDGSIHLRTEFEDIDVLQH